MVQSGGSQPMSQRQMPRRHVAWPAHCMYSQASTEQSAAETTRLLLRYYRVLAAMRTRFGAVVEDRHRRWRYTHTQRRDVEGCLALHFGIRCSVTRHWRKVGAAGSET